MVLIVLNHYAPKPIDWRETYDIRGKSPYGCYILNKMGDNLFPNQIVSCSSDGFYLLLDTTSLENKNLIVITSVFKPDKFDLEALLKFVARGNDLFVSASTLGELFSDSLNVKLKSPVIDTSPFENGKERLYLLNPELRSDSGYQYNKKMHSTWISAYDTLNSFKLGTNRKGDTNFIFIKHGSGKIYLHTQPQVFTNYHLLYGDEKYASNALSYLPVRKTVFDNYYKPYRSINQSPMHYILSQPPLQWAYYLLLITLVLYLVVESKRRQRIIPVLKPVENSSLQFVRTIGSLYFKQRNNSDLARKMTIYFKDFLKERYHLVTPSATDECVALVSVKSGVPVDLVRPLLEAMDHYQTATAVPDGHLIELNYKIELFYKQCF